MEGNLGDVALYRKYRPASFAEVVGQEHVTEPLSIALDSGRINHAYLFSGPRGCGKTSSARILARSLNCAQGPTSRPCGVCDSCRALAPGGPGSLDVTELDAASHRGVDDMRDLRDRAFYAPADSRYRVFIIDEAHMITTEGFNTLLKIVEEPPEHLIFIFATTEPEKLLATIRSRTHNYPFRLLTPPAMRGLLEKVVHDEGAVVEDSVYPLVVRAGGGSPRDSLSIMDQLLAGAEPEGVTYQRAVGLLGVTDSALLDRAVDALAEQDQAELFSVVDDVIDAGYDPRRFAMDLLDRFRDLLVVQAVPDAFERGLVDVPADQREGLECQAQALGQATLTRCAAVVNEGIGQMRGATTPRLLLEILCARMALPAAGMTVEALAQRVEALEQGNVSRSASPGIGSTGAGPSTAPGTEAKPELSSGKRYERPSRRRAGAAAEQTSSTAPATLASDPTSVASSTPAERTSPAETVAPTAANQATGQPPAVQGTAQAQQPEPTSAPAQAAQQAQAASQQGQSAPQQAQDDDPVIAQAREAREIMDRHRAGLAQRSASTESANGAQPGSPAANGGPAQTAQQQIQQPDQQNQQPETPAVPETTGEATSTDQPANVDQQQWENILAEVKAQDLSAWIAGRDARLASEQPQPDQVLVEHSTGALAKFVNSDHNSAIYQAAAKKILGKPATVVATVGGAIPGKAQAGSTDAQSPQDAAAESATPQHSAHAQQKADPQQSAHPQQSTAPQQTADPQPKTESASTPTPQPDAGTIPATSAGATPATDAGTIPTPEAEAATEAGAAHGSVPGENNLDSKSVRSAAADALERARQMAEGVGPTGQQNAPAQTPQYAQQGNQRGPQGNQRPQSNQRGPQGTHTDAQGQPLTGWRARAAKYQASREYKMANGFNGVPLPDEPPADPWDSGPANYGNPNYGQQPGQPGAQQGGHPNQPGKPGQATAGYPNQPGQQHNPGAAGGMGGRGGVQNNGAPIDEEAELRRQQDELMDDLASGMAGECDTRKPLDIAGALIEQYLGGERTR